MECCAQNVQKLDFYEKTKPVGRENKHLLQEHNKGATTGIYDSNLATIVTFPLYFKKVSKPEMQPAKLRLSIKAPKSETTFALVVHCSVPSK